MGDYNCISDICIRNLGKMRKNGGTKNVFEWIMAENSPNWIIDVILQIQEAEQTPRGINSKKIALRHNMVTL